MSIKEPQNFYNTNLETRFVRSKSPRKLTRYPQRHPKWPKIQIFRITWCVENIFNVEALELPRFLPFRSFFAVFRALLSRRTLWSRKIPDLALVVSVPTVCFKNERYTSTHSLCSSLQRCKKRRNGEKKKEAKSALLSRTALLLRHRLGSFSRLPDWKRQSVTPITKCPIKCPILSKSQVWPD